MSRTTKRFIPAALVLVFLVLVASNGCTWGTRELQTEKTAATFCAEVQRGKYQVVTTPELREWIDNNKSMLIVDTMPYEDSFKKNHIPEARQMEFPIPELTSLDDKTKDELLELLGPDKNRTIVFYCGFTKCTRSHNAAMWAVRLGYNDVYRLPGGVKAWKEAGYQLDSVK